MGSSSLAGIANAYSGTSATSLALAGGSLASAYFASKAQRSQANIQAGFHRFNAKVAEAQEKELGFAQREERRSIQEVSRRVQADQSVAIGSSGFTFQGQRSTLIAEAARGAERDAQISHRNYKNQKSQLRQQAAIERFRADDVKRAGKTNQFATLLSAGINTGSRLLG